MAFDLSSFEVGDEFEGSPAYLGKVISAILAEGGTLDYEGASVVLTSLPNRKVVEAVTIVPEPLNSDPTTPDPIVPDPVTPEPIAPEPIAPEPIAPEPIAPEPIAPEPITPPIPEPEPEIPEPITPIPVPEPVQLKREARPKAKSYGRSRKNPSSS